MLQYAVAIFPLITRLKNVLKHKQCWYPDDSCCVSQLVLIKHWFLLFLELGPFYGYFAEASKSVIVWKEQHLREANYLSANMEVSVVPASQLLGRCIRYQSEVHRFVRSKVKGWVDGVECLAKAHIVTGSLRTLPLPTYC